MYVCEYSKPKRNTPKFKSFQTLRVGRKREQILSQSPVFCLAFLPGPFRTAGTNLDWSQLKLLSARKMF